MADFTSLDNVKEFLAHEGNADDAVLERLIGMVSAAMEAILSRTILAASYTETFDGAPAGDAWGATHLVLKNQPVNSISSVSINGTALPASNGTGAGWLLVDGLVELIGYSTSEGKGNVTVVYNGGYTTVPPALEHACIQLVAMRFRERTRLGVSSENNGAGMNRVYDFGVPPWAEKILNQFSHVVPQ